jgi:uncharacterized protein
LSKDFEYGLLLDFYAFSLTEKQVSFLDMYYNQDCSLSEIAKEYSVSRQAALDFIKRGSAKLKKLEDELGLFKKFDVTNSTLEACRQYIYETKDADLDIIKKIDYALMIWEDKDGV